MFYVAKTYRLFNTTTRFQKFTRSIL